MKLKYLLVTMICSFLMINGVFAVDNESINIEDRDEKEGLYEFAWSTYLGYNKYGTSGAEINSSSIGDVLETDDGYIVLYPKINEIRLYDKQGNKIKTIKETTISLNKIIQVDSKYYVISDGSYYDDESNYRLYIDIARLNMDGSISDLQRIHIENTIGISLNSYYKVIDDYIFIGNTRGVTMISKDFSLAETFEISEMSKENLELLFGISQIEENDSVVGLYKNGVICYNANEYKIKYYANNELKWSITKPNISSYSIKITTYNDNLLISLGETIDGKSFNKVLTVNKNGEIIDEMDITEYFGNIFLEEYFLTSTVKDAYPLISLSNGFLLVGTSVSVEQYTQTVEPIDMNLKASWDVEYYYSMYFKDKSLINNEIEYDAVEEPVNEKVPETGDNIIYFVIVLLFSTFSLMSITIVKKHI